MDEKQNDLSDTVGEVLSSCLHPVNVEELRIAAHRNGITLEQLIAAAITGGIEERFTVRPKPRAG